MYQARSIIFLLALALFPYGVWAQAFVPLQLAGPEKAVAHVQCGGYEVRTLQRPDASSLETSVVILRGGVEMHRFQSKDGSGWSAAAECRDLTGDGYPDVVILAWSGGMHCCTTLHVVGLAQEPVHYRPYWIGNGSSDPDGWFESIDGKPVLVAHEDNFAYWGTSYASSPAPRTFATFDGAGWRIDPVLQRNAPLGENAVRRLREQVGQALRSENAEFDVFPLALRAILDLIYSGHSGTAWQLLAELRAEAATLYARKAPERSEEGKLLAIVTGSTLDPDFLPVPRELLMQLQRSPHHREIRLLNGRGLYAPVLDAPVSETIGRILDGDEAPARILLRAGGIDVPEETPLNVKVLSSAGSPVAVQLAACIARDSAPAIRYALDGREADRTEIDDCLFDPERR